MYIHSSQVICTKVRDGDKRIVRIKEGNPAGRHVIIVDDLVQSGGTLIECHAVLARAGAKHENVRSASTGIPGAISCMQELGPGVQLKQQIAMSACVMYGQKTKHGEEVSAYVTHGVFPKFSWQKFKADAG
eukprot:1138457-Pelagomonas_calceolata.AAC.1